jgi:ADP-ribose pyrophosphatase YjhB (NUDIX family)
MSAEEAKTVEGLAPVACVDLLPVRQGAEGFEAGLISRAVPEGGEMFALVGGRVLKGESINEAVTRQLRETLGFDVSWEDDFDERLPDMLMQYFQDANASGRFGFDLSKHSIGLTWRVEIEGKVETGGEATSFRWFPLAELPPRSAIGYRQWLVVEQLLGITLPD